jgi:ABC-type phosphate/phosphonate transport system ATPase subunit
VDGAVGLCPRQQRLRRQGDREIIALRPGRVIEDAPMARLNATAFEQIYARAESVS